MHVQAGKKLKPCNSSAALFTVFEKTMIPVGSLKKIKLCLLALALTQPPPREIPPPVSVPDAFQRGREGLVSGRQVHLLPYLIFSQASAKAPKCTIDFPYTYFTFLSPSPSNTEFSHSIQALYKWQ